MTQEEMMQESPFYQLVIQRGIEQGAREVSIKNILFAPYCSLSTQRYTARGTGT